MLSTASLEKLLPGLQGKCICFFLLLCVISSPLKARGGEIIISTVVLNEEDRGYLFVTFEGDDLFVRIKDVKALGLKLDAEGAPMETIEAEGERYLRLRSIKDIEYSYDKDSMTLDIKAGQSHLASTVRDFMRGSPAGVQLSGGESAFLNYKLDYIAGSGLDFQQFTLTNELGAYIDGFFFRTDSFYTRTDSEGRFIRLMTSVTHDDRRRMTRTVLGDFFAPTSVLGSAVTFGGIGHSKLYRIDPYFAKQPMFGFSGSVSRASEVEVYADGVSIMREKVPAGTFELKNIASRAGSSDVEVVIREPFSQERRVKYPLYFTDAILRQGLHEYSYNLGFIREGLGVESASYGRLAFSGFHRYSLRDYLNVGLWGEATSGAYNAGPEMQYLVPAAGVISLLLANSMDEDGDSGLAGSFTHTYQGKRVSTRLLLRGFTEDYSPIINLSAERLKYEIGAGIGYGTQGLGSVSLDYASVGRHKGAGRNTVSAAYSVGITSDLNVFASVKRTREGGAVNNEFFAGLTYYPWKETLASANFLKNKDVESESLSVQKNPPFGEGQGYRLLLAREKTDADTVATFNPSAIYNARYAVYTGEYRSRNGRDSAQETYELTAAGSVTLLEGILRAGRPVSESFGVVRTGKVKGVRVYQNNQPLGRTDSSGEILIPTLVPYSGNQISVDARDFPINYRINDFTRNISPSLGSGSPVDFSVESIQAVTGVLKVREKGRTWNASYGELGVIEDGVEVTFPTGMEGEFYLEGISPGEHGASIRYGEKRCVFSIAIPESASMIIDLGEIICEGFN